MLRWEILHWKMLRRFAFLSALSLVLPSLALAIEPGGIKPKAQDEKKPATGFSSGEFRIDRNLTASLYDVTVKEARGEGDVKLSSSAIMPQFSLVKPIKMQLANNYFTVPYESNVSSIPMLGIVIASPRPLLRTGNLATSGAISVGYGYSEGIYQVEAKSGLKQKDTLQLHWIPVLAMLRSEYAAAVVRPSMHAGLGGQWLSQNGNLDGMQQSFWMPVSEAGAGLTFFDGDGEAHKDFFQGVHLGATYKLSLWTEQTIRAWSLDVGTNLIL